MITIKKAFTVMLCAIMAVILSACGTSELIGKWQATGLMSADKNVTDDFVRMTELPVSAAYQIEFRQDGTGTVKFYYDYSAEEFTWKKENGKIYINDFDAFEYSLKGGQLKTSYLYQMRFGPSGSIYDKYCNYRTDGQTEADSVILEKVEGFEGCEKTKEIALTRIAGFVCSKADREISALLSNGDPSYAPSDGTYTFSTSADSGSDLAFRDKLKALLANHGLEDIDVELTLEADRCVRVKLTDRDGYTGVYDVAEAAH